LINQGRHYDLSLIGACRSPSQVHRDFTRQADYIIIFSQHEPIDLAYLSEFIPDIETKLSSLLQYDFICYNCNTGKSELNVLPILLLE